MKVGNKGSGVWGGVVGVTDKARCKTRKSPTCYSARKFQGEEKRKGVRVLLQLKASRFSLARNAHRLLFQTFSAAN